MRTVLQPWVCNLTFMQQSVLIAAIRGPDGIWKDHKTKLLCRWLRRCVLISAFDGVALLNPVQPGGGSFTGPSMQEVDLRRLCDGHSLAECDEKCPPIWQDKMDQLIEEYLRCVDELPHHFQLHFMHAAEIIGYKHPDNQIRCWWNRTYLRLVNDAHLMPEPEERMDIRLSDCQKHWRAAEEVTAKT